MTAPLSERLLQLAKIVGSAARLKLTVDALMQPIGLLGNRGSGKSYGGMKILELAVELGIQCIAVDGIGKWWGLRLAADGSRP